MMEMGLEQIKDLAICFLARLLSKILLIYYTFKAVRFHYGTNTPNMDQVGFILEVSRYFRFAFHSF